MGQVVLVGDGMYMAHAMRKSAFGAYLEKEAFFSRQYTLVFSRRVATEQVHFLFE